MRRVFIPIAGVIALGAILAPLGGMSAAEAATSGPPAVNYVVNQPDGTRVLPWQQLREKAIGEYRRIVGECKAYTPFDWRNDPAGWQRFCDGLAVPVIEPYAVWDPTTGEVW